nr:tRNA:M(4)X modification enzyme TRM13 homolog isoform X1 [Ipomoea batatas]GME20196.1 tRNA:M(4)X modification enzyme TRM13 homolog isoform X1 [Ipomoea batatas]
MEGRCKLWLPKKNSFCGNHTERSDGQWIPCPIDPSHSVLEENLESHLKRCPLLKQTQSLSLQPFYEKGINAGTDSSTIGVSNITSEMKRNAVYAMTVAEFSKLISKIKCIHASICTRIPDSFKNPQACGIWTNRQVDRKLPFEEKHVLQQASILGNLEEFGVLKDSSALPTVVEFGAGRGYLTQVLTDCYGFKKVLLVERKAYKLKADRSLRQKEGLTLERLRIDIEDLKLKAVECLRGAPYLAIGKHLCGPATDMTLRCCTKDQCEGQAILDSPESCCYLTGLAIATCCHHLCQWRHYINTGYMLNLGISMEDFHAVTWFTSWAVDADHTSDLNGSDCTTDLQISERESCELDGDVDPKGVEGIIRNMKGVERAALGFMCKDIIDAGRMAWLKEVGLECQLVKYVPSTISPENHLLVARQKC